jgi:selenocysteine lyase/cysteine desulfurase
VSLDSTLDCAELARTVKPGTRLVVATHAGNVSGALLPLGDISRIAHAAGALLLVDAAQSAGCVPLDVQALGVDLLAFSGHKGLLGPAGTGGLVIGASVDASAMAPLLQGGTGSRSEFHEQPEDLPDKFESGTPNGPGLAGLGAGVRYVMQRGIGAIRAAEMEFAASLIAGLSAIRGVTVYGPRDVEQRVAVVSFNIDGRSPSDVGLRLGEEFDIMSRVGLHCAPAAHRTLGTFPRGTVRFAPGLFTTKAEIEAAVRAVERIARG